MASSMKKTNGDGKSVESTQLLYSDVFGQSYQEDRLRIVGKPKMNPQERLQTFSVPHSSVLSQLKSFLPQLSDANLRLAEDIEKNPQRADEINIECVDGNPDGKHIEMNLSMVSTINQESDSDSDVSSDGDDDDVVDGNEMRGDTSTDNDHLNESPQFTAMQMSETDGDAKEKTELIKLKLPASNKTRRKHKASIEVINQDTSLTFQEESANR